MSQRETWLWYTWKLPAHMCVLVTKQVDAPERCVSVGLSLSKILFKRGFSGHPYFASDLQRRKAIAALGPYHKG